MKINMLFNTGILEKNINPKQKYFVGNLVSHDRKTGQQHTNHAKR